MHNLHFSPILCHHTSLSCRHDYDRDENAFLCRFRSLSMLPFRLFSGNLAMIGMKMPFYAASAPYLCFLSALFPENM